jgi:DNA-binding beta-propeller fold protein YncE
MLPPVLSSQNLLNGPDCAVYDATNNRYLISNWNDGSIVAIDDEGTHSYFDTDLWHANGGHIEGDILYATVGFYYVNAYNLTTDELLWHAYVPGSNQLDGITADNSGYLYTTDYNFAGVNQIFKFNISDQTSEVFVSSGLPDFPQELIYDEDNDRLLLVSGDDNAPILAIDPTDASVSTVVTTSFGHSNGIAMDNDGNWYVTCSTEDAIYRYDNAFANPPVVIENTDHPTALGYNPTDNILAVPNFDANTVTFISLDDTDGDGIIDILDNCPDDHNPEQCNYLPGEADGLPPRDILDIVHLIDYKFKECPPGAGLGTCPPPTPFEIYSGDADCNCIVDILDIVHMIDWKFKECPPGAGQGTCPPPCSCEDWISICQCPIR